MQIPASLREIELCGGHPALDFVNTVHSWLAPRRRDHWPTPLELIAWHQHAGLVDRGTADAFAALESSAARRLLREARAARQRLHTLFAALAEGRRAPEHELAWLESQIAALAPFRRLEARDDRVVWTLRPTPSRPASLLAPALYAAADLLTSASPARVKACPPPDGCGWLFVDTSRNGSRVWCSMRVCGNVAKVRRFRSRQR